LSILRSNNQKVDGKYLFWSLKDEVIVSQLYREATGVTRWAIASRHIKNSIIPLPPLLEQKAIVRYLDKACARIDKIIAIKQKQLDKLKEYFDKKVVELLSNGLTKNIDFKETNELWIKKIPSTWKLTKLKYEIEVKDGTHDTPSYETNSEGNFPFVTSKDITNNKIDFSDTKFISPYNHFDYFRRSNPKYGDIIMPMIGTLGNCAIVKTHREFSIKNVALFKTSDSTQIITNYLFYFLESNLNKEQFYLKTKGGVQSFLSLTVLRNLYFIFPPKEEQKLIANQLDELSKKIQSIKQNINNQITALQAYRKSLIHECVTGKKQVWEGDIEKVK
jgi:type I restriction enzyme S subunit